MTRAALCRHAALALAGLLVGCAPVSLEPPPPGGVIVLDGYAGPVTVTAPAVTREQGRRMGPRVLALRGEPAPGHTVVAGVITEVRDPAAWSAATTGMGTEERLRLFAADVERSERAAPSREGAVLRSFAPIGGARPAQAAQGAACEEHMLVSEDRRVPGAVGKPYVFHQRSYSCIDPRSGFPVQLIYSERFPEATASLRPGFAAEADAYFDSLRFE